MFIEPYLYFNGRCDEAIEFYHKALGAQVDVVLRFNEAPQQPPPGTIPAGFENKVMHSSLRIGNTRLMASDGNSTEPVQFGGVTLSLSVDSEADADRFFNALADGGRITMPLAKTFFSSRFGMVHDRFGVSWIIIAPGPAPAHA
jgi:PhnB protein